MPQYKFSKSSRGNTLKEILLLIITQIEQVEEYLQLIWKDHQQELELQCQFIDERFKFNILISKMLKINK